MLGRANTADNDDDEGKKRSNNSANQQVSNEQPARGFENRHNTWLKNQNKTFSIGEKWAWNFHPYTTNFVLHPASGREIRAPQQLSIVWCLFLCRKIFPHFYIGCWEFIFSLFGERVKYKSFFLGIYDDDVWREEKLIKVKGWWADWFVKTFFFFSFGFIFSSLCGGV